MRQARKNSNPHPESPTGRTDGERAATERAAKETVLNNNAEEEDKDLLSWLLLAHLPGMYSRLFNRLLDEFREPARILTADVPRLEAAGTGAKTARLISRAGRGNIPGPVQAALDKCLAWLEAPRHAILHRHCPDYPHLLSEIPDAPPLLYVHGSPGLLQLPMLAMVGSRRPSVDGRRNARRFAAQLAEAGLGICSGLALGIDVESHAGAFQGGGFTVAVLGTGIDQVYPTRNRAMFDRIAESGALVSEFNPGTPPLARNFPCRNRIISGLSLGVLVVEAGLKSGSMITAKFALEQGREVFAVPGSIHNPMAKGCHHLITQGAKLTQQVEDIAEECAGLVGSFRTAARDDDTGGKIAKPALTGDLATTLAAIGRDPVGFDDLLAETRLDVDRLSVALAELELQGHIRRENAGFVLGSSD